MGNAGSRSYSRDKGNCLRWFEHIRRRPLGEPVWNCDNINLNQVRGSGKRKLTWTSIIHNM